MPATQIAEPSPTLTVNGAPDDALGLDQMPTLRSDSTLADALVGFDEYMLRKGFSDNTITAFRNDLKIFGGYVGETARLHHIGTANLEDYLEWLQHERGIPCSAKTLARRITTLKVLFGWLHGIGVLGTDPAEPVAQQPARQAHKNRVLSLNQTIVPG